MSNTSSDNQISLIVGLNSWVISMTSFVEKLEYHENDIAKANKTIVKLRTELVCLTKICEDVLAEKTYAFPQTSVAALASAIALHSELASNKTFIEQLITEISEGHRRGYLSRAMIESLGFYLEKIGFVDKEWYFKTYPDVELSKISAGSHYIEWGQSENRIPNRFTTKYP